MAERGGTWHKQFLGFLVVSGLVPIDHRPSEARTAGSKTKSYFPHGVSGIIPHSVLVQSYPKPDTGQGGKECTATLTEACG